MDDLEFCTACQKDLEEVLVIERENFHIPWKKESFLEEIKLILQNKSKFFVLKVKGKIIGYVCCRVISPEAEVLKISVKKEFQGKGYGRKLLEHLITNLDAEIKNVYLEVRESNIKARKFYEMYGFEKFLIREKFYPDKEDAVVMKLELKKKGR